MRRLQGAMFLWLMFLSRVLGAPTDEFGEFTKIAAGDILPNEDKLLMNIVPGYALESDYQRESGNYDLVPDLDGIDKDNEILKKLNYSIRNGYTFRGLTFNIYDDRMREAAIALFRLFQLVDGESYLKLKNWAENNINKEMFMYALRMDSLYGSNTMEMTLSPPFISNPHYFVNSETIIKALRIAEEIKDRGAIDPQVAQVNQYEYTTLTNKYSKKFITINSNYSGWNRVDNGVEHLINYFTEDVALNSYYLGLHIMHPFWMTNDELDKLNPRHAEHYYYAHQQLMARYLLEKIHYVNESHVNQEEGDEFVPYLAYKNGLPFPTRTNIVRRNIDVDRASLKKIDIAIKECIARGLLIMENGTKINMTDDSHIEVLSRLIRANLDGVKNSKLIRAIFGGDRAPADAFNPAPSLLYHPETSLRDPVYWYLIKYMLNYFIEYKNTMEPFDLAEYENDDINIVEKEITNITTYFHNYKFTLSQATSQIKDKDGRITYLAVRQRRLSHKPFVFNLAFESRVETQAVVRLYLGPQCGDDCWQKYSNFFELDTFFMNMNVGLNEYDWISRTLSKTHSFDEPFDTVLPKPEDKTWPYTIFKFPDRLLIPQGLENGLNFTLFVMVTPAEKDLIRPPPSHYRNSNIEHDSKPLGFPFHRPAVGFKEVASNYRFFNITVFHKRQPVEGYGNFAANLY